MSYPEELRYTKEHEWIRLEGDRGRVGITAYAQSQLGDVVFVELPEPGRRLNAGESFGTVESVKAVSELFSPVTGDVIEVNAAVTATPELINKDPHGEGWMVVLKIADPASVKALLDAKAYQAWVESEGK